MSNINGFESDEEERYYYEQYMQEQYRLEQEQHEISYMCKTINELVNVYGYDYVESYLKSLKA